MKNRIFIMILLFLSGSKFLLFASEAPGQRSEYLFLTQGGAYASFKDMGTSPLRYQGVKICIESGYLYEDPLCNWGLNTSLSYMAGFTGTQYMLNYATAAITVHYVHNIPRLSQADLQILGGGSYTGEIAFTFNDTYQNAAANLDLFNTLSFRGQLQYDFTLSARERKIAFIRLRRPARDYSLIYAMDIPVFMFNIRPDYPYVINGLVTDPESISRHAFIGGFRLRSRLGLRHTLKNGNAFEVAYSWNMLSTGKRDIYLLETASHHLHYSFCFRVK
jgi:hypothetical protein